MSTIENCSRCGQPCEVVNLTLPRTLPAMARDHDGRPVCDVCVADETVYRLTGGRPSVVYIDHGQLTTWGGTDIGRVTKASRGGTYTRPLYTWAGVLTNGVRVYGRHGDSQSSMARRYGSARQAVMS